MQAESLGKQRNFSVCKEKSREVKVHGVHLETNKQPQFLTYTFSSLRAATVNEIAYLV